MGQERVTVEPVQINPLHFCATLDHKTKNFYFYDPKM